MKLVGIMSLRESRTAVRRLLENHGLQIYSETEILGYTRGTIAQYGWFAAPRDAPSYSTLYFAIVPDEEAEAVFSAIESLARDDETGHPVRAFLVPVERMV
ncbi:MAG: hypothetical protein R6X25_04400 [Candidatus Krumholzibacteriia bacterium]